MTGWDAAAALLGVVRFRDEGDLDAVLASLGEAGVPLLEVTLDTPGALDAVERAARGGRAIGAGTVVSADDVSRSVDAGAGFVVSPGVLPDVIERALRLGVDVVPGALTPTEILRARSLGASAVKLFPAGLGGPGYIRAVRGPFPDVSLVPTGGIGLEEVGAYLDAGASCVGLGSSLVGASPPAGEADLARIAKRAGGGGRHGAAMSDAAPDVIALGETMLSLVAVDGSLIDATTFLATHGGAESNACVELARLGTTAAWVSRLGADAAGERVATSLRIAGVDLSWVRIDETRPTGAMLRDVRGGVAYLREGSAASTLSEDDLVGVPVEAARAVFTTGITPMLGPGPGSAALRLLRRGTGIRAFDVNLRRGLWGSDRAAALLEPLLSSCDVVFGGRHELALFAEGPTPEGLARAVARRGPAEVVLKRGRDGAGALDGDGRWHECPPVPVEEVDPVGAGDAFDAGYLDARLRGADVAEALRAGAESGAAVAASLGDTSAVGR